jgi:hypothetical protein
MDTLIFLNEINSSFTTLLNTLPFFHDKSSITSWFIGICVTLSTLTVGGGLLCTTLGGVGMYEYYKDVQF